MIWRLAVAVAALTGLMTSSTILVAQVTHDIEAGWGGCMSLDCIPKLRPTPPDGIKPLSFGDLLSLVDPTDLTLPPGSIINPDGSITLPDGTEIPLDAADLRNLSISLPQDGALKLPEGSIINPDGTITLPENGTLSIPGVGDYDLPAGSTMDLPEDVAQSLLAQNYEGGVIPKDTDVRLGAGTELTLPSVKAPTGTTLPSSGGTTLAPPGGAGSLGLPPGTITEPTDVTLPPGTTVEQKAALAVMGGGFLAYQALNEDGSTASGYTPDNLPPPTSGDGGTPTDPDDPTPAEPDPVDVSITWDFDPPNQQIQKGVPFDVAGVIRSAETSAGISGVPLTLYANGNAIGSGTSTSGGAFGFQATIPESTPAGEVSLVMRSDAGTYNGVEYEGGYAE